MDSKQAAEYTYQEMLKNETLVNKYQKAGIYSIKIKDKVVYIGKSREMLQRIAAHIGNIEHGQRGRHKYDILREAKAKGYSISFDVLYVSPTGTDEDIGYMEGVLIRQYAPPLNTQIPKKENWKKYNTNPKAKTITLNEILS